MRQRIKSDEILYVCIYGDAKLNPLPLRGLDNTV